MTPATLARFGRWLAVSGLLGLAWLTLSFSPESHAAPPAPPAVDFNSQIRPILSENCFACHGPDEKKRKAKLRLDLKAAALGHAGLLVPGKPDESELIARLVSDDADQRMPPPKSGKKLTKAQTDLLRRWVAEGAPYSDHWAFVPPRRPALPQVRDASWPRNPVDAFLLARLGAEGLRPTPEADKVTLLRRVTLDLTGLPPTPAEADAFLADASAEAYEKVVDRLLQSPHYGEHQTRFWLDAARYGDTHGLHLDNYREIWPYRDWVIRAFNDNKRFDTFAVEQLAGDLLPDATLDQVVATGYNRCHVSTSEGGSIDEEVYVRNVVDQVDTNGTVFLGLSFGCARCHDHKYDPVTAKEYYGVFAFFNSLDGKPLDGNAAAPPPVVRVPRPEDKAALAKLQTRIAEVRKAAAAAAKAAEPKRGDHVWIDDAVPAGAKTQVDGGVNVAWNFVDAKALAPASGDKSLRLEAAGLKQLVLENASPGLRVGKDDTLFAYVYIDPKRPPKEIMLQWHSDAWRHRAYWGDNVIAWGADNSPERLKIGALPKAGAWVRLEVDAAKVGLTPGTVVTGWAFTQHDGTCHWDKAGLVTQTRPEGPLDKELAALEKEKAGVEKKAPTTLVFKEQATPRPAFVLKRGEYDQRGEPVGRGVPTILGPLPQGAPLNRLGFAQWLVSGKHPLTARVAVNRFWQQVFGTGLVKTAEDFGAQGEPPTHPELLDWLAVQFVEDGWDVKKFLKRLVMSNAYRQSSKVTPERLAKDPGNRLLSRGPRYRLDAEMLRDQALAAGGLLVETVGGPGVKPPQPAGLWEAVGYVSSNTARFTPDAGREKVHRRSLYTFWKRTSPPPQMTTFDAPSREACQVRRERTNTPLQALLLMNETQYVEAARALAERGLREGGSVVEERIALMFRLAAGRRPDAREMAELTAAYRDHLATYTKDVGAARKLVNVGESKPDVRLDPSELAALTMVGNVILNLDEVITKG